ncbi:DUF1990 domain-containing protein [Gryllotalpicola daejeonensis]|uniref:DUF1990 domain-containing protein n=1 Tax=Gryllotalpicola daejeonensis TaxID=993087 RepID=A0ABP7ZEM2_9MICO
MSTAGRTYPELAVWPADAGGRYRRSEISAVVGDGDSAWKRCRDALLHWGVKTRSGFRVNSAEAVRPGTRLTITAGALGITVREPIEVVRVVDEPDRVGFSYRTLPGHPVDGEEAFILERSAAGIRLIVRSLTRPAPSGAWRVLFPLLLIAQTIAHRRYLRALR